MLITLKIRAVLADCSNAVCCFLMLRLVVSVHDCFLGVVG